MKFVIFYFSGTGNIKWAVDKLDELLRVNGHKTHICSIETIESDKSILQFVTTSDYIGFAYPIFGADIPRIMRNFIKRVSDLIKNDEIEKKKVFIINTFGYINGHGIFSARKQFDQCYFKISGYINIRMTDSSPLKGKTDSLNSKKLSDKNQMKAFKKLSRFVQKTEGSKLYINGIGPHLLVGIIIRRLLRNGIINNYQRMHVDINICTKCMKCIKNCPTQSILFIEDTFVFAKTCEACMRCYNDCPTSAIFNYSDK